MVETKACAGRSIYWLLAYLRVAHTQFKTSSGNEEGWVRQKFVFAIFHRCPAFLLMTINNVLVGSTLGFFDLCSPLMAFLSGTYTLH
jgi:hypothetical protein